MLVTGVCGSWRERLDPSPGAIASTVILPTEGQKRIQIPELEPVNVMPFFANPKLRWVCEVLASLIAHAAEYGVAGFHGPGNSLRFCIRIPRKAFKLLGSVTSKLQHYRGRLQDTASCE